jgi:site-specific DNA-methyltransferase (adenine-specific)
MNNKIKIMLGDNMSSLIKLPDNSVDRVVTDPPYGLSFMGKKWDYDVPSIDFWKEVLRVLKPGGMVLSFGGTRTYHRMAVNIEDAGFEIRDQIMWIYGTGFPKSHNIGKAVDIKEGNKREVIGSNRRGFNNSEIYGNRKDEFDLTKGNTKFEGWGSALKPANEPICVARKPLSEKTVAENMIKWGTGGINIDGCRIEGRFPANIIFGCTCDEVIKGEKGDVKKRNKLNNHNGDSIFKTNIIGQKIMAIHPQVTYILILIVLVTN